MTNCPVCGEDGYGSVPSSTKNMNRKLNRVSERKYSCYGEL